MSDCSKHKKEVAGISNMKELAEMIGDLHYQTLSDLFEELAMKLSKDGQNDINNGRHKLGHKLQQAAGNLEEVKRGIISAWIISKPFMNK